MHGDREADALAAFLKARGMRAGSRIGVECDQSFEMSVARLAVRKTGATQVDLDLTAPESERREFARDLRVDLVLTAGDAIYDAPAVPAELCSTFWRDA